MLSEVGADFDRSAGCFGCVHGRCRGDPAAAVRCWPVLPIHDQDRPDFPPDRPRIDGVVINHVAVVRRRHEQRAVAGLGMAGIPASRTEGSTEEACIAQVPGTGLFGSGRCVLMFGFASQASGPNRLISAFPSSTPQSSPGRPPSGHAIACFGFVFPEHRHQHVEVRGIIEAPAGGVLGGFGDCLANRRLHLIRVRLCQDPVEVKIHGRLVDAVEVLQVRKRDQPALAEPVGLIAPRRCLRPRVIHAQAAAASQRRLGASLARCRG